MRFKTLSFEVVPVRTHAGSVPAGPSPATAAQHKLGLRRPGAVDGGDGGRPRARALLEQVAGPGRSGAHSKDASLANALRLDAAASSLRTQPKQ